MLCYFFNSFRSKQNAGYKAILLTFVFKLPTMIWTRHHRESGLEMQALDQHFVNLRGCTECKYFIAVGMQRHHFQRAHADGSGRPQNRYPLLF